MYATRSAEPHQTEIKSLLPNIFSNNFFSLSFSKVPINVSESEAENYYLIISLSTGIYGRSLTHEFVKSSFIYHLLTLSN